MTGHVGYAYPWDVLGDPSFIERLAKVGLDTVALPIAYHSTRAATPHHPARRLVDARYAALYRPVRAAVWGDRRLKPASPVWLDRDDSFDAAAEALNAAGFGVEGWVVITHSSRLAQSCPDLAVENCFGDSYGYALCPSHPEVRDYAALLATEAVRNTSLSGISLEACNQLGLSHNGQHEKTDGAFDPLTQDLLSVCCCSGCRAVWQRLGADADDVRALIRRAVIDGSARTMRAALGAEVADLIMTARLAIADELFEAVLASLRREAPGVPVIMQGSGRDWATGPSARLGPRAAAAVDAVLVPAWWIGEASRLEVQAARATFPSRVRVDANVTALPPVGPGELVAHVQALQRAGAEAVHFYHLGLAGPDRLAEIGRAVRSLDVVTG